MDMLVIFIVVVASPVYTWAIYFKSIIPQLSCKNRIQNLIYLPCTLSQEATGGCSPQIGSKPRKNTWDLGYREFNTRKEKKNLQEDETDRMTNVY